MDIVKRLLAAYLVAIATAVALHFIFASFYRDAVDTGQLWNILNWFMAVAVLVTLIVRYLGKVKLDRQGSDGSVTRKYLEVNAALYLAAVLTIWFFWNWFDDLMVGADSQSDIRLILWAFIDPLFVLIVGTTGCRLWQPLARR